MHKNLLNSFIFFLIGLTPGLVSAECSPFYLGVNAARFDSKFNSYEPRGAMAHLGWDMNNWLALELAGGGSENYRDEQSGNTTQVDYVGSAFVRFNLRFNHVTVYLLGGYSSTQQTATTGAVTTETSSSGGSYGYGIDFYGTRDLALSFRRVEFIDIDDPNNASENVHLGATMIGITYYFDKPRIHRRY